MKDQIKDYLITHKLRLKELLEPIVIAKDYMIKIDFLFNEEIMEQFNRKIRSDIANEVSKDLACDYETIIILLEDINLMEYLK